MASASGRSGIGVPASALWRGASSADHPTLTSRARTPPRRSACGGGSPRRDAVPGQRGSKVPHDEARQLLLRRNGVLYSVLVLTRPEIATTAHVDELDGQPHLVCCLSESALQNQVDLRTWAGARCSPTRGSSGVRRRSRHDLHALYLTQGVCHLIGQPLGKELVTPDGAQIQERSDRERYGLGGTRLRVGLLCRPAEARGQRNYGRVRRRLELFTNERLIDLGLLESPRPVSRGSQGRHELHGNAGAQRRLVR